MLKRALSVRFRNSLLHNSYLFNTAMYPRNKTMNGKNVDFVLQNRRDCFKDTWTIRYYWFKDNDNENEMTD